MPPKAHFSIWYFVLLLTYLQPLFFSSAKVETISYSQFKQYIADGKISELTIGPDNIKGTLAGTPNKEISTIRVDDPGLVKQLDEAQISYSGKYQNKFLAAILS